MASAQRTADDPLSPAEVEPAGLRDPEATRADLLAHAVQYDFFYLVGMLERLTPHAVRVGGDGPYDREAIRFHHDPDLTFSAGDVSKLSWGDVPRAVADLLTVPRKRFDVTTTFLGVTGSATPMPLFMAEEITQAQDSGKVRRDFLDVFHHRLVSFLYRVGIKFDLGREFAQNVDDVWTRRMLALAGYDRGSGRRPKHIPLWQLVRLAPLLANGVRSARVIEKAIHDACRGALGDDAEVLVIQFAGGWVGLDGDQRMLLQTRNSRLGQSAVLGVQCYHRAGKAIIRIGPLHENFRRFMQDGDMYPVVCELLEMMCPEPVDFELDLVLAEHARPPFLLGDASSRRLGTDSWLSSRQGATKQTHLKVPVQIHGTSTTAPDDD